MLVTILESFGTPVAISYKYDTDRLERIRWMEDLVINLPFSLNQAKLHFYIQCLRTSDVNSPNWDDCENYYRGEQRWMATHMCYDIHT